MVVLAPGGPIGEKSAQREFAARKRQIVPRNL
jgi:hypothetical protein